MYDALFNSAPSPPGWAYVLRALFLCVLSVSVLAPPVYLATLVRGNKSIGVIILVMVCMAVAALAGYLLFRFIFIAVTSWILRAKVRRDLIGEMSEHRWLLKAGRQLDESSVKVIEAALGFELPKLVRDLYTQVGAGGWGAGYGLELPVVRAGQGESGLSVLHPAGRFLALFEMGCTFYIGVDCSNPELPVVSLDMDDEEAGPVIAPSLYGYLCDWYAKGAWWSWLMGSFDSRAGSSG